MAIRRSNPAQPQQSEATAETRLLLAARRLFCREGIHATGVSRLLKEANVARRTLYERYGSKENVLRAVFANEASMWYQWFDVDLPLLSKDPHAKLLALFDLLHAWFDSGTFHGCIFVNAVAEHGKDGGWIQAMATKHTKNIDRRIGALAKAAGLKDPHSVTQKLSLVIDGAIVTAMVTGDAGAAHVAQLTARDVLQAAAPLRRRPPAAATAPRRRTRRSQA